MAADRRDPIVREVDVDAPVETVFAFFVEPDVGVAPGSSTVEITLHPIASGTRVRLVHRDLPPAELEPHAGGWTHMLDRLARAVSADH